jgi:hypothetical protein
MNGMEWIGVDMDLVEYGLWIDAIDWIAVQLLLKEVS